MKLESPASRDKSLLISDLRVSPLEYSPTGRYSSFFGVIESVIFLPDSAFN
jgi:hypothetical protein